MSLIDSYHAPAHYGGIAPPHRKPLPPGLATRASTLTTQSHSRTRTSSSSVFPLVTTTSTHTYNTPPLPHQIPAQPGPAIPARRAPSIANSTNSSIQPSMNGRSSTGLQRTPSNRSGSTVNSPTSYVSLMRKQKATVWCDRSQHEDPRLMEQRRQAKLRAAAQMAGGGNPRMSVSTASMNSSVRSKIMHHGRPKAQPYNSANLSGTGVPMRLSATEVEDGDSDDDSRYEAAPYHRRTGSGRSSLNSGKRMSYATPNGRFSTSSTPPSNQGGSPEDNYEDETPVPGREQPDYFTTPTGLSGGSGSSGERENSFGGLGQMPEHAPRNFEAEKKANDDLRRRGSVDDRSMTMSGNVRLFVANPDNSDSD